MFSFDVLSTSMILNFLFGILRAIAKRFVYFLVVSQPLQESKAARVVLVVLKTANFLPKLVR